MAQEIAEVDVDKSPTGCRVRFVGTQTQAGVMCTMPGSKNRGE